MSMEFFTQQEKNPATHAGFSPGGAQTPMSPLGRTMPWGTLAFMPLHRVACVYYQLY